MAAPARALPRSACVRHAHGEAGRRTDPLCRRAGRSVVPDLKRNLPGRGLWVTATRKADRAGRANGNCSRSGFKRDVKVDAGPRPADRRGCWSARALDALAIAGKAGEVVSGFAKVEAAIGHGGLLGLIHAADGGRGRPAQAGSRFAPQAADERAWKSR